MTTELERLTRALGATYRIAREAAGVLGYAHSLGIVHRDIKPENILLRGGQAFVADFGIALAVQSAGGARMTQTGLSLGTPQYMSPEQAMGERTIDARSDVYALGAVTYEMLAGDPPFTGSTVQSIVTKVLTEKPVAPCAAYASLPKRRWCGGFRVSAATSAYCRRITSSLPQYCRLSGVALLPESRPFCELAGWPRA